MIMGYHCLVIMDEICVFVVLFAKTKYTISSTTQHKDAKQDVVVHEDLIVPSTITPGNSDSILKRWRESKRYDGKMCRVLLSTYEVYQVEFTPNLNQCYKL